MPLHDPNLPAGAIDYWVEAEDETGELIEWGIRNDGKRLISARHNPWYVLMTLCGEEDGNLSDEDRVRNRKGWNAWAGQKMKVADRAKLASSAGIDVDELAGWIQLKSDIETRFRARAGMERDLPDPNDDIDLSETAFRNTLLLRKAVFPARPVFYSATFSARAWFGRATFAADALFNGTTFSDDAVFASATFTADAVFASATFSGGAWFDSATFSGPSLFRSARFQKSSRFVDAMFDRPASFRAAEFQTEFPILTGAILHPRTEFSGLDHDRVEDDVRRLWPEEPVEDSHLRKAEESAATIRQVMGQQGLPEVEHFFFRKEMSYRARIKTDVQGRRTWEWLPIWLFGFVSNFGYSIARPALALAGSIWLGWGILASYLHNGRAVPYPAAIWQGLGVSFSNTFAFLGFSRTMLGDFFDKAPPWVDAVSGAQTVFGVFLLFFLGLGLRTRFRLR